MRVFWVTPHFPDPGGSGGTVHQFELLRSVARLHEISILTTDWSMRREAVAAVRELGVTVRAVAWPEHVRPRSRVTGLLSLIRGDAPTLTLSMRKRSLEPLADALVDEHHARPADLVFIVMGDLAPVADAIDVPTALLLFDIYWRQSDSVRGTRRLRTEVRLRLERRNALRWERQWYPRAEGIACVSDVDARLVSTALGRSVETIPNPVPDDFFSPPHGLRSTTNVTFVGSFGWEPNIDSVLWLCDEIWPLVLRRRPDARLRIVGRKVYPELRRAVEAAGGECHADVDDIRPYYWDAAVIVAPIRMGSGTRNKVLHAMACRAPVVATRAALEGIAALHGKHLLVADDGPGLAEAILTVLDAPAAAAVRAEAATEIAGQYSSAGAGEALCAWWEATAGTQRRSPPVATDVQTRSTASVVVCTRDRPELLRTCLLSIGRAVTDMPETEVIVVEQGRPAAGALCSEIGLPATVVRDERTGVSRARNIGAQRARGDVVLFTDDDCEVPADWVERHLEALADPEAHASFGEVSGLSRWGDAELDPAARPSRHSQGSPPWLIGHSSNMAVRRAAFLSAGGFDERLGPGSGSRAAGEDADLIVRLLRSGAVLLSGTGEAVRHIEWRSVAEHAAMLVAYEHGAGVWIGKALREQPRAALAHLRWRVGLLRDYAADGRENEGGPVPTLALAGALARGLATGVRMHPWRGRPSTRDDRGRHENSP